MSGTVDSFTSARWGAIEQVNAAIGSGDCARVVSRTGGELLFFLGDVAGHDTRAASFARDLGGRVSDLAKRLNPGALLTILNAGIERSWPQDLFVTAICFSLDPEAGEGAVAVAGQLPPVVKRSSSSFAIDVQGGPPLGVLAGQIYDDRPFRLTAGELLVAATDGVTDPLAAADDLLGLSSLARLVDQAPAEPTGQCDALVRAARRAGLRDDATVLAVAAPCRLAGPAFHGKQPDPLAA